MRSLDKTDGEPVESLQSLDGRQGCPISLVVDGQVKNGILREGMNYDFFVRTDEGEEFPIPLEGWESLQLRWEN